MSDKRAGLIIDGLNFLWKAYAAPFEFSSDKGTRLDVITVFLSLVRGCVEKVDARELVIVFDHPKADNYRLEDENYKTNRIQDFSNTSDSPFHHLDNLKRVLEYLSVNYIESDLAEADDIVYTLVQNYKHPVFIASSDTDFYQCVGDRVKILKVRGSKNIEILDKEWISQKLDVRPEDYVLFKSLTGDKADNIVGISGVGPKTAAKIVNDKVFAGKYDEHRELIEKNMALINLLKIDQLDFDWSKSKVTDDLIKLKNSAIFEALGF